MKTIAATLALVVVSGAHAQACRGDIGADGRVDGADLGALLSWWGPTVPANPVSVACDLDGDGRVDGVDLASVLSNWGPCQGTIGGVTPSQGCFIGGTAITITGTYLDSASAVIIGGVPATSFTAINPTTLTAITPAGAVGAATLQVTTAAGTLTAAHPFTYMPPSVNSLLPNQGVPAGGSLITISGAYLGTTTSVTIGGSPANGVTVIDANTLTFVTPPGVLGPADVVISGAKGTTTIPGGFRYVTVVAPAWSTVLDLQPDPAVVTDPALRAAIAASALAWRVRDTGTGIEMLLVPPGTFQMGCVMASSQSSCPSWEEPVHQVTLTNAYYLGRYEVTQAQWAGAMGSNPSFFGAYADSPNRPVEEVRFTTIQGFLSATGLRLPTEAEWEYACRAGTPTPWYNGSTVDSTVGVLAWYNLNAGSQTHAVGGKAPNGFGFNDMYGNVWEWVSDWYGAYSSMAQTNPTGPATGNSRVIRGGAWNQPTSMVRSSTRMDKAPGASDVNLGFRVARNP